MAEGARAALMPLDDALALIRTVVSPIADSEILPLEQALGRALAADMAAPRALPPFDSSAVDGYAFRRADLSGAGAARLTLAGESAAGVPFSGTVPVGRAVRISTGAVLPEGADTVAMQEDCTRDGDAVVVDPVPPAGANVRLAGNDIRSADKALSAGARLRPQDIALARALGFVETKVLRKLRVAIAPTGAELREGGADLGEGQIVETNGLMLAQLLDRLPLQISRLDTLPDDRAATERALQKAVALHDVVLTTGGVSVGDHDHVRGALERVGHVHFWRLAIRPGKPVLFGAIGRAAVVGLPGNPVSALVTCLMVVRPLLDALLGAAGRPPPGFPVPLGAALRKPPGLRDFQRARIVWDEAGPRAVPYRDQSSNLITSMVEADGLLDLPVGRAAYAEGENVLFRPFALLAD